MNSIKWFIGLVYFVFAIPFSYVFGDYIYRPLCWLRGGHMPAPYGQCAYCGTSALRASGETE